MEDIQVLSEVYELWALCKKYDIVLTYREMLEIVIARKTKAGV